jgi:hypothetical protein
MAYTGSAPNFVHLLHGVSLDVFCEEERTMSDAPGIVRGSAARKSRGQARTTVIFEGVMLEDDKWEELKECLKALACKYHLKIFEMEAAVTEKRCEEVRMTVETRPRQT